MTASFLLGNNYHVYKKFKTAILIHELNIKMLSTGVPFFSAEITPIEPDLVNTSEGSQAHSK